ncbi:MAG: 50S ribosomal protein L25 [Chloroflexota bacterium]
MSTRPSLVAEHRTVTGKKVNRLRRDGILPAVIFGGGKPSQPIQISALDWEVLRRHHVTRNTLLDITVGGGKAQPVLVQSIEEDPRTRRPAHVDFHVVKMGEELAVDVPIVLVGDAPAVADHGGTLIHLRETVHIKALPADLPTAIEVDVTSLADFEHTLHVSDIVAPKGVHILTDGGEQVARVMAPRHEIAEESVDIAAGAPAEGEADEEA